MKSSHCSLPTTASNPFSGPSDVSDSAAKTCFTLALRFFCLVAILIGACAALFAASGTGRVAGTVVDPSEGVVAGAQIRLRALPTGIVSDTTTDESGRYQFDLVPAGHYEVSAIASHFAAVTRKDIEVNAGAETTVSFRLSITEVKTVVNVVAESDIVAGQEILSPNVARSSDTASLLAGIPGLSLYGNGGVSSLPVIHGMEDDRIRILVNGMDLVSACANHMNPPLSYIDPTNVGAIKVFAGITPVSAGGDSVGGTIAVDSPAPEFAGTGSRTFLGGEAGTFYRSNGGAFGAHLSFSIASEALSLRYAGSVSRSGDYSAAANFEAPGLAAVDRGWLPGNVVGSSRYESQNHALDLAMRHKNQLLALDLGFQNIPYQGFPNQRMDMTLNDNGSVNLRHVIQFHWGILESRVYGDFTRHRMDFGDDKEFFYGSAATVLAPGMPMDTKGLNVGGETMANISLSNRDTLNVGLEAQRYRLNDWWPPSPSVLPAGITSSGMAPNAFVNIRNGQRDRIGVFAEWERRWTKRWTTLLGGRSDTVLMNTGPVQGYNDGMMYNGAPLYPATTFNAADRQRTDHNFDVTAIARFSASANLDFEGGYARKTHSPNLYERYAWSTNRMVMEMVNFAGDGNYYVGNLELRPEIAQTVSGTVRWHGAANDSWGITVTPFVTYGHDFINAQRCPITVCGASAAIVTNTTATAGFVYLQFVNQNARLDGVDLSIRSPRQETRLGSFRATGLFNAVRGKDEVTGDNLYNIMPVNGRFNIIHTKGKWNNYFEEELVDGKRLVSQVRNEIRTGGYGLMNLRTSYELKRARLDLGLDNVLNKFYALPLGGTYVGQGATMSSIPWGIPMPGSGRSFYVGLTLKLSSE
ncbi:MAG TPA: TonB-dependent receptor [Bryobacteraceae bacterium]|nr:TonB-dependent receptor [Bryobacteraceae bacterium]